mgnify:CR=1 FL=1
MPKYVNETETGRGWRNFNQISRQAAGSKLLLRSLKSGSKFVIDSLLVVTS